MRTLGEKLRGCLERRGMVKNESEVKIQDFKTSRLSN